MSMSMSRRWLTLVPAAALSLVVLAGCGNSDEMPEGDVTRVSGVLNEPVIGATPEVAEETPADNGGDGSGGGAVAQEVTIVSHDIYFDPKDVTVPAAADVKLVLPNEGAAPHNFSIDALNVSVDMGPGETKDATINAPAGDYEYYCNVPGHKEAGMVGKLTSDANAKPAAAAPAADEAAPATDDMAAAPATDDMAAAPAAAAEEFTVAAHDIYFEPKELTVPAATDVKIKLPNEGAAPHNFAIDALNVSVDMAAGETTDTTINAPAGDYEYYCNVPGHKEAGMVGKLTAK